MTHITNAPDASKQSGYLPDKATFLAIFAGAINVIGAAALLKGWLLDIGMRYYDGMSSKFNLPRGVFIPSETRILQSGYARVAAALGEFTAICIIISFVLLSIFSISYLTVLAKYRRSEYQSINKRYNKLAKFFLEDGHIIIWALSLLSILGAGWLSYVLLYKAPKLSLQFGESVSISLIKKLQSPGCPECQLFGNKEIRGVAVFADDKSLFVGTPGPGLVRIPLDGITIIPRNLANRATMNSPDGIDRKSK